MVVRDFALLSRISSMPTRVPWRRRRCGARMMCQEQVSRRARLASWRRCRRPRSPTFCAAPVSPRMASPRSPRHADLRDKYSARTRSPAGNDSAERPVGRPGGHHPTSIRRPRWRGSMQIKYPPSVQFTTQSPIYHPNKSIYHTRTSLFTTRCPDRQRRIKRQRVCFYLF